MLNVRADERLGIRICVTRSARVSLALMLGLLQAFIIPDGHHIRPDSDIWGYLLYSMLLLFILLSLGVAIAPKWEPVRVVWRLSFLIYIGTIGSAMVNAPGVAILLLIFSAPAIGLRFLFDSSRESRPNQEAQF